MNQKQKLKNITEIYKISKLENEIFGCIFDLMDRIQPLDLLEDNCGNEDNNHVGILRDSYDRVMWALEFIIDQIVISPSFSHLNPFFEKLIEGKTEGILFTEIAGQFHIGHTSADE